MKASIRLAIFFLVGCTAVADLTATPASRKLRPLRVVIDASRDGGAWWFPQGPAPFGFAVLDARQVFDLPETRLSITGL